MDGFRSRETKLWKKGRDRNIKRKRAMGKNRKDVGGKEKGKTSIMDNEYNHTDRAIEVA